MSSYNEIFGAFLDSIDTRKVDESVKQVKIQWYVSNGEEDVLRNYQVTYMVDDNDEIKLLEVYDLDEQEDMGLFIEGFQYNQKFLKEVRRAQ